MVHNTVRCCEDHEAKLTRWEQVIDPLVELVQTDIEARADNSTFVKSAIECYDNLAYEKKLKRALLKAREKEQINMEQENIEPAQGGKAINEINYVAVSTISTSMQLYV